MKRKWIGRLLFLCCLLIGTVNAAAESEVKCSAVNYCETELKLSDQKIPIRYDGSGDWLNTIEKYFDIDVSLVSGTDKMPLTDAKLIFACSTDGLTFDSCQTGKFVEVGTYTLRVSVEADDQRYYLPVYADTSVKISDDAAAEGLTVQYTGKGALSGSAVEDWEVYQPGDSAIILGNFGLDADGNPDPLMNPGYELSGWREVDGVREFSFGDSVVMNEPLRLDPIWTNESTGAPVAAVGSVSVPTQTQQDTAALEAMKSSAVQFFPVRSDGDRSNPVLLFGAKTLPNDEEDLSTQPQTRILDGFYTPDGQETQLIVRRSESNTVQTAIPTAAADVIEMAGNEPVVEFEPVAAESVEPFSVTAESEPVTDNPFETEPVAVIETGSEPPFIVENEPIAAVEAEPEPQAVSENELTAAAKAESEAAVSGAETVSVPSAPIAFAAPAPAAKQVVPVPNAPVNQGWERFDVNLPQTGLRLTDGAPVEPLDPVGMTLELPAYGVKADIVVVPFVGNTWDVARLRGEAGVLEGFDLPGEGISILAAHNHLGPEEVGPFLMIGQMESGDRIFVSKADGTLLTFEVYENKLVLPDEFETIEALSIENPGSIVLVTCENETIDGAYSHRRAVFAKPVAN